MFSKYKKILFSFFIANLIFHQLLFGDILFYYDTAILSSIISHKKGQDIQNYAKICKTPVNSMPVAIQNLYVLDAIESDVYADLLLIFSQNATKPLFDQSVSLGENDTKLLDENFYKIERVGSIYDQTNECFEQTMQFLQQDIKRGLYTSAKEFLWSWMGGSRVRARKRVLSIAEQAGGNTKKAIYDEAKSMWSDITVDEDTFYTKLKNGDYDSKANFLHHTIMKDTSSRDLETYQDIARGTGARPIDIVAKEGKDGLEKGKAFYADSAKLVVGKIKGGDKLIEGYEKAENTINKLDDLEKNGFPTDLKYYKKAVKDNIKQRAYDFFKNKTGIEITDNIEDFTYDASAKIREYFREEKSKRTPIETIKTEALDDWDWGAVKALVDGIDLKISDLLIQWKDANGSDKYFVKPLESHVKTIGFVLPDEVNDAIGKIVDSASGDILDLDKMDVIAKAEIKPSTYSIICPFLNHSGSYVYSLSETIVCYYEHYSEGSHLTKQITKQSDGVRYQVIVFNTSTTQIQESYYNYRYQAPDGTVEQYSPAGGPMIMYFENGKMGLYSFFLDNGNLDGIWFIKYPSGQLRKLVTYMNGVRDGRQIAYSEDGNIQYDDVYANGRLNGEQKSYDDSGNLQSCAICSDGVFARDCMDDYR